MSILKALTSFASKSELVTVLIMIREEGMETPEEIEILCEAILSLDNMEREFLIRPIDGVDMLPEVCEALKAAKFRTLGELVQCSENNLYFDKKMSKKKIKLIVEMLRDNQLTLKE